MELKPDWYDVIARRMSRRRFDGRPVPAELREQLEEFCDGANAPAGTTGSAAGAPGAMPAPVRACLVDDVAQTLFTGLVGGYGKITGTRLAAAFVGRATAGGEEVPEDVQAAVGYLGEAIILEATRLGLGTCWIAGTFDHAAASKLTELQPGERVVAVSPLGYPTADQPAGERFLRTMVKASARLSVEKLAPGLLDGDWPAWAVAAVQAARLAPSGANRQPWRFRRDGEALVMSRAEKLYWTSPIDLGIARLHVELGAAHEGVTGSWTQLPEPDVAEFSPAG
jgi:nitroreductase